MNAETTSPASGSQQKPVTHNVWTFLSVMVPMATLVALAAIILGSTTADTDAVTLLGIVIPAVVAIGTAAFGVAVAYDASSQKAAAETDKATAEKDKVTAETESAAAKVQAEAAEQKVKQTDAAANELAPHLETVEDLLAKLRAALPSPAGEDVFRLPPDPAGAAEEVVIDAGDLASAEAALASARRGVQRMT